MTCENKLLHNVVVHACLTPYKLFLNQKSLFQQTRNHRLIKINIGKLIQFFSNNIIVMIIHK